LPGVLISLIILHAAGRPAFAQKASNDVEFARISGLPRTSGLLNADQAASAELPTDATLAASREPQPVAEQAKSEQSTQPEQTKPEEQPPQQPAQPAQTNPSISEHAASAAAKSVELFDLLDKKSIVFPDIASTTVALTPAEKFELFVDNTISVHSIVWAALGSLIGQAADSPTGFGERASGYPKRFSTSLARSASGEFFGTFALASALHEDPRFFPQYKPAFKQSIKYSVRRLFVTRNDSGDRVVNVSGLVGPLLGESLANVYWPDRNRTVGDTLFRYGLDLAARASGNMFRNYWPVVFAKLRHVPTEPSAAH
jgi:hypothetical protein